MNAISLCSGADGFGYAASLLGIEVVAHVELNKKFDEHYKRYWPNAQRFYDLTTIDTQAIQDADIIFGGEPCQGNSVIGNREGKSFNGYIWPDYFRVCKAKRPRWIINENVIGSISNMVLDTKITDLESIGYTCAAFVIPACSVGAFHERERVWIVAYTNSQRRQKNGNIQSIQPLQTLLEALQFGFNSTKLNRGISGRIFPTPMGGFIPMVNDVPTELAEIEAYGNAVVPWIPYVILKFIIEIEASL